VNFAAAQPGSQSPHALFVASLSRLPTRFTDAGEAVWLAFTTCVGLRDANELNSIARIKTKFETGLFHVLSLMA
jgi:hypothetical protein